MPEALAAALAMPGLWAIGATYLLAGVVRGFTGFGTALIVVPVAGIYLEPLAILLMITVTGVISNVYLVPHAWGTADRGEVGLLALGALPGVVLGMFLLNYVEPVAVRWVVAAVSAVTLAAVISGWQWRGRLRAKGLATVGGAAGTVGGLTALTGPIAIMFYLANARQAQAVRANMILFLASLDVLLIGNMAVNGALTAQGIWLGALVSVPYIATIFVGQALFDPGRERAYRIAAYTIAILALLTGLPIWE
ncbi:MAG: TSUP family transporter [Pseudomonadota bacterium]